MKKRLSEMKSRHKTLYRKYLEDNGFVSTRATDLDLAVSKLHMAICQLDLGQLEVAENLLSGSVRDLINKFGEIEELRRGF